MPNFFHLAETVYYNPLAKSEFYILGDDAFIIDFGICENGGKFPIDYSLITDKQNDYVSRFKHVFRFLFDDGNDKNDKNDARKIIFGFLDSLKNQNQEKLKPTSDRENFADSSPLEFFFENEFAKVYGEESVRFLNKEYPITDGQGRTFYLDYLVHTKSGDIAVEENGINFHHPQIIGREKYKTQLEKQNECAKWKIRLFRFSTEDLKFGERIQDDIKRFFGSDSSSFLENGILANRKIKLYEHQKITLSEIQAARKNGTNTFLVVLPTAAGKSKIVEEDLKSFYEEKSHFEKSSFRALILAPNTNITDDCEKRVKASLPELESKIEIRTYAFMSRNFRSFPSDKYSYIVADEAHHVVAPTYKRVIQYFAPEFLIGLTATDERPDKKRLEEIFGSYKTNLSLKEAMDKKIIAEASVFRLETNLDLSHVRFNGKDYVNADLEKTLRVTSRNDLIAGIIEKYFCGADFQSEQGIVFCVNTNHAKEMARILAQHQISASSYTSRDKNADKIMQDFKSKKIRFLCSCNMISEGWDYPPLKILVMARPTLSKVLYLQQIGRGLRKTAAKENVFVIDVVDEYGAALKPCSMHSVFKNPFYVPFGLITRQNYKAGEMITVDGLFERIEKIVKVDIEDFSEKYQNFLSVEQLAREFFVGTETLNQWIKKGKITPDASFDFGSRKIFMFAPDSVQKIRADLNLPVHNEKTIHKDFFDFLSERDYTFSYKMPFLLSLLKNANEIGEAKISFVVRDYTFFYLNRLNQNLPVDKKNCPYTKDFLADEKAVKENMIKNPFEKFERKRFLYIAKDLDLIAVNPVLWQEFKDSRRLSLSKPQSMEPAPQDDFDKIKSQMAGDLQNYFKDLGGLAKSDSLVNFARGNIYHLDDELPLLSVADSSGE